MESLVREKKVEKEEEMVWNLVKQNSASIRATYPLPFINQPTMRGCALPLTKLVPPPHLGGNAIKSFPFPIVNGAAVATQQSFPSNSLTSTLLSSTLHHPHPNPHFSFSPTPTSLHAQQHHQQQQPDEEEENFQVLTSVRSDYNDIMIVDTPKSRMLLLDSSRNNPPSLKV